MTTLTNRLRFVPSVAVMPSDPTLLSKLAAHLDKHLLLPVLRFAAEKAPEEALRQQYRAAVQAVLAATTIMDESNPLPEEKQKQLEAEFSKALIAVGPLKTMYFSQSEEAGLRLKYVGKEFNDALRLGEFSSTQLQNNKVVKKNIKALYDVGFMLVDSGNYEQAADVLKVHNVLTTPDATDADATTNARNSSSLWGQYICDVLLNYADSSREDLDNLLKMLDDRSANVANSARVTLLHYGLFHYFRRRETSALLDLVFHYDRADRSKTFLYANVIQCLAPHLLRYVAIAAVLNKKKKATLSRAARLLEAEVYQYSDPFTSFLVELCVKTNFARATELLADCDKELSQDYFACDLRDEFMGNARQMIFEDQLRVRKTLSIATAAQQLGLPVDKTELWLVDLIREAKMDATVDSVGGTVRVNVASTHKSVWMYAMDRLGKAPATA
jgi:translation initiation factor 3 subunit E